MEAAIKEKLKKLPNMCGVYILKSQKGEVLYIGKATSLQKRVKIHFAKQGTSIKESLLANKVKDIEYVLCDTPEQALILEASLVKEMQPKYNVMLKDDKSYPYVEITKESFPRVFVSRPKERKNSLFFGPYVNAKLLRKAIELIRKIFPFRSCLRFKKNPCLYYHLNLCPAPCKGTVSEVSYRENIENVIKILKGERKILVETLERKMRELSEQQKFEEAAKIRDKLVAIYALYSGRGEFNQLKVLKEVLRLNKLPLHIEAIDVACLSFKQATGSVVVFKHGLPNKSDYRRYKIKEENLRDDYKMICEVVRRRYSRLLKEGKSLPNLIVVDGGGGHVNTAYQELKRLKLSIFIIGLAKKNEEIWLPMKKEPLILPKDNPALQLLQRIRDEAHRFAHKYHLILRKKQIGETGVKS